MIHLNIEYSYKNDKDLGIVIEMNGEIANFNTDLLNIGNLLTPSKSTEVIAVIFDLEGFTNFTKQVDPRLSIPKFITDFFNWLFNEIKIEIRIDGRINNYWSELPFFSKFLGDGVLFLWKIDIDKISKIDPNLTSQEIHRLTQELICNTIATMFDICKKYDIFLKKIEMDYVDPPLRLRCGIARGDVYSIGDGKDYVGPCINIASRLQNFHGLSFGVSARGIDSNHFDSSYASNFVKKKVGIRGIGENEIIYIIKDEYTNLNNDIKLKFK